ESGLSHNNRMQFKPLGDQAVLAYCADEAAAFQFAFRVKKAALPWNVDIVQAYTSVAVYYDLGRIDFDQACAHLQQLACGPGADQPSGNSFVIPCCFEMGLDWPRIEKHVELSRESIIDLYTQAVYTVYAIGFCPGFP